MKRMIMVVGLVPALWACGSDEALEAGDCPGTPTELAIDPVAPFVSGLLALTFQSSTPPGSVEVQRYSPSRGTWEPTYGTLGQRDDGTFVLQIRPQANGTDATAEYKLRIRALLQGCPPSDWAESDPVMLGDPVSGTTWVGEFGRTDFTSQINVNINNGAGTNTGPYRLSPTVPLRHTIKFSGDGAYSELFDFAIESATAGDVYAGCHFMLGYEGTWVADYDYDTRVGVYDRHFTSLMGSTCTSPPLADLRLTAADRLEDTTLSMSSVDYSRLLETTPGPARWPNYNLLQQSFSSIVDSLVDQIGADTSSISGYVNIFNPIYEKQ